MALFRTRRSHVRGEVERSRSAIELALSREWFYRFTLPDGSTTRSYLPEDVESIHTTRLEMVDSALAKVLAVAPQHLTCIDLACHEGFFAVHMSQLGYRDVLGVDARPENIEGARLMREIYRLDNLRLDVADVRSLDPVNVGDFDVVLMLGLLYHLSDPVGALRLARLLTREVCIVETQLAPTISGSINWGSRRASRPMVGGFAVIDETTDAGAGNREANVDSISLVPSLEALLFVLRAVGFDRVEVVAPPSPDANEQLVSGNRVLVCAQPG